nr:GGDEF domain-containing protein [Blautia marasmi]
MLNGAAYFFYHWNYFNFVSRQRQMPGLRTRAVILFFIINYMAFVVFGALEFHLVMNWLCFAVLLFGETMYYTDRDWHCTLFSTLTGIIYGLAINILCRNAIAIITGQSLQAFDNHISSPQNLKAIPVFLGFVLAGFTMQVLSRARFQGYLRLIMDYRRRMRFLLELLTCLFFYLFLNLLIYSTDANNLLLKGWSIKSGLFSMMGFAIGIWYTWRTCVMAEYQKMNQSMEQELETYRQEEPRLLQKALRDPLTGLYNRQHAVDVGTDMLSRGIPITICFVDLDELKKMNDRYGHAEGDRYIRTVTGQLRHACRSGKDMLFRYGGDEFLLLFPEAAVSIVESRMEEILSILAEQGRTERFQSPLSFSYGVIDGEDFSDFAELVQAADKKMYMQKKEKHRVRK